ncbi:MAG TPA: hypothetical protein VMP11_11575 [Verrucomicrobiae bacterium]|nr:hypothetical protein [Verrucomicrobiae bacterium]
MKPQSAVGAKHTSASVKKTGSLGKEGPRTYFEIQVDKQRESKIAIAKYIVKEFLQGGDSIVLDAGTSLSPIAEEIAAKAVGLPERTHFTIMTHNYEAFQTLVTVPSSANLNIVLAGGRYDKDLNALFGPQTTNNYSLFFPRVVLIGASGFVAQEGLFCHGNTEELSVKQVIFKKGCRDRIIITDYTKLGTPDALKFGESKELKEGATRCIVVTNKPPKSADNRTLERYDKQIELLQNNCKVEVRELQV